MKRKILYLITTILIIGVVMFSLPFSVSADQSYKYYAYDSVDITYSGTGQTVHGSITNEEPSLAPNGSTTSLIVTGSDYSQYITTDFVKAQSTGTYLQCALTSNSFNASADKETINYIGFDTRIAASGLLNDLAFEPVAIMVNGKIIENAFTASIVSTVKTSYNYPNSGLPQQFSYSFYRLMIRIRLNDTFRFRKDDDVKFILRSEVIVAYDPYTSTYRDTQYAIGIQNLEVGHMNTSQLIESTAKDVNDIKGQVTVIGDTAKETQNIVNNIYNIVNQTISSEQQAIIDQNNIMIQDRHEMESSLDDDFSQLVDNINNNDYQIIDGDNFDNGNVDVNQNVQDFNSSGMGNFFRSIWELDFIKTAVLLSLGFLGIKIGIYGV